ncbi:MAG TPA: FtsH protease activity modulator HflK [Mariprofundaceae bacterium]|nr:FtsH protease activity modulator HflK [Mariprofundaceae bacterium]
MPWSDQNQQNDPWGRGGGGRQTPPPDLDEVIRRIQERLSGLFGGRGGGSGGSGGPVFSKSFFSAGIGIIVLLWLASGIYSVKADEEAVVLRFGQHVATTGPGLNWHMPYPVETVEKVPVTRVQRLEIGFRGGQTGRVHKIPQEALMLTKDENIVDISFIVQYRVKNVSDYLFNVAHPSDTVRGAAESAIREVIGRTMIDDVLTTKKAMVEVEVERLIQSILDGYKSGISIAAVKLRDVQPPEPVIKDFKDVASAREDRERAKNEAQAYANDILPKARGEAKKMVLDAQAFEKEAVDRAQGEAERFVNVLNAYRKAPNVTRKRLYMDAMQDVLSKVDKVIVDKSVAGRVLPYLPLDRMGKKVEVK